MFQTALQCAEAIAEGQLEALFITADQHELMSATGLVISNEAVQTQMYGVALLTSKRDNQKKIGEMLDGVVQDVAADAGFYAKLCHKFPTYPCLTTGQEQAKKTDKKEEVEEAKEEKIPEEEKKDEEKAAHAHMHRDEV
eukprot:TRINITY_DN59210_c0_g1_i3.p3 TRINITY_DN59210_c0_g1~~TRINITY_DN59210_c0_g1_i3.p3  ORF type:complete len:139 (-),score=35.28 TRINITY_DN59210_c0_g1_i3:814-1230(-)